jgi:uncharacterized membrane protein
MDLHPATVHFPIALLMAAGGFYVASRFREQATFYRAAWLLHLVGLAGSIAAVLTGRNAEGNLTLTPALEDLLETHQLMGYATAWLFALLAVWQYLRQGRGKPLEQWLFLTAYWLSLGVMIYGAWLGGQMVYEHGAGVQTG